MAAAAGFPTVRPTPVPAGGGRGGAVAAAGRAGALLVLAVGAPIRVLGVLATHGYLEAGTHGGVGGEDAPAAGDDPPP